VPDRFYVTTPIYYVNDAAGTDPVETGRISSDRVQRCAPVRPTGSRVAVVVRAGAP